MSGAFMPDFRVVDIEHVASDALDENTTPAAIWVQTIALGVDARVVAHVIVPTALGMLLDDVRNTSMTLLRHYQSPSVRVRNLLEQFDRCVFQRCAYCTKRLPSDSRKPRQLVLHIVGGVLHDAWSYEFLLGLLCWRCASVPWSQLAQVDEFCYGTLSAALNEHSFKQHVPLEPFMEAHDNNNVAAALSDAYLWRIAQANAHSRAIARSVFALMCTHCHRPRPAHALRTCSECHAMAWCADETPDTRLGHGKTCADLAQMYHGLVCAHIQANTLLHMNHARVIKER